MHLGDTSRQHLRGSGQSSHGRTAARPRGCPRCQGSRRGLPRGSGAAPRRLCSRPSEGREEGDPARPGKYLSPAAETGPRPARGQPTTPNKRPGRGPETSRGGGPSRTASPGGEPGAQSPARPGAAAAAAGTLSPPLTAASGPAAGTAGRGWERGRRTQCNGSGGAEGRREGAAQ